MSDRRTDSSRNGRRNLLGRRNFLKAGAAGILAAGAVSFPVPMISKPARAAGRPIKIGYVSPRTGPIALFGEADAYVLGLIKTAFKDGIRVRGVRYPVEIVAKDSQSNPSRAAEVAAGLILRDKVDLMLASSTPETTNPVADQCELNEVPCITTVAPWQNYYLGRGGDKSGGFEWTYHFFWGVEDIVNVFLDMWKPVSTNKKIGLFAPNDADGLAYTDPKTGLARLFAKDGYKVVDSGRFEPLTDDFTSHVSIFKNANVDILTGVSIPPDFVTFWTQARQQGLKPKICTMPKALLFPSAVESLGKLGKNLSTEIWWSATHPFKSSLDGLTCAGLAKGYESATGKQWTQPLGFVYALFEAAADILSRTEDVRNNKSILEALTKTRLDTVVGRIDWSNGPVKNVSKTPLVGGQWRPGKKHKYDLVITSNKKAPEIAVTGAFELIT